MIDKLKEFFGDSHTAVVCTRTWDAWGVGTMSQDDFHNIIEDEEMLEDLANHLTTYPPGTEGLFWDDSGDHWYGALGEYDTEVPDYRYQAKLLGSYYQHFTPMEKVVYERLKGNPLSNNETAQ